MMLTAGGPPGELSFLIVGHQWPSEMTIASLNAWIDNRIRIADSHDAIADLLNTAQTGPLAPQHGKTADALMQAFSQGEQLARDIAKKNGVKKDSYTAALNSVHNLRDKLSEIAKRYDDEIKQIIQSSEPAAVKGPQILAAIGRGQQEANLAAANCGSDIGDAGQRILDQEGADQSFRQFAKANGIDMGQLFRARGTENLEPMVRGMLAGSGLSGSGGAPETSPAISGAATGGFSGGVAGSGGVPEMRPAVSGLSGAATGGLSGGAAGGGVSGANALAGVPGGSGGGAGVPTGVNPAASGMPASGSVGGSGAKVAGGIALPPGANAAPSGLVASAGGSMTKTPVSVAPAVLMPAAGPNGSNPQSPELPSPQVAPSPSIVHATGGDSPPAPTPGLPGPPPIVHATGGDGPPPGLPGPPPIVHDTGSGRVVPAGYSGPGAPSAAAAPPPTLSQGYSGINAGTSSAPPGMPCHAPAFQSVPPGFASGEWMHHADLGLGTGANSVTPAAAIPPPAAPTAMSPTTSPTAGAGDWHSPISTEQSPAPQASSPSYSSPAASPTMNAPTNPGYAPSPAASSPSYSGGALPAYGSDLRPAAASVPAVPPSPPPAPISPTASGSPTTNPAAGSSSVPQPAVARPVPPQLSAQPAPMDIAGRAVIAGAGGVVAGAVSADATARIRLQRIVDAVARQEPRLAWAAGDRPDHATVLLTDLASGWIPPGIEIPSAVTLLEPARRRGDLESLLGEVKFVVDHTPNRYVPEADEPVPTSPRPRRAPEIEELGWELSSATHWRDGLPRLAHTLAKAASSGTGVDPSEVELLHQHMRDVGERVLDAYPDEVDFEDVGNWQLLAAIDALMRGDKVGANYHFAWFRAWMTSTAAQSR